MTDSSSLTPDFSLATRLVSYAINDGFSDATLTALLGTDSTMALHSACPAAAEWFADKHFFSSQGSDAKSTERLYLWFRVLYLREAVNHDQWVSLIGAQFFSELLSSELVYSVASTTLEDSVASEHDEEKKYYRIAIDIRPLSLAQFSQKPEASQEIVILSDTDASVEAKTPRSDHVPGVGQAPLSLLGVIPPHSASEHMDILDMGCGSGVLSLALSLFYPKAHIVGTDISHRALAYARASEQASAALRLHKVVSSGDHSDTPSTQSNPAVPAIDWRQGSWFDPVAGEKFDLIVSNPPFVITPPRIHSTHTYRESGLELDGASRLVVQEAIHHLKPGGYAHILSAWALQPEETSSAISTWFPRHGVRAWVLQREEVDISLYISTWLRDENIDPRSTEGRIRTRQWLDYFHLNNIDRVSLGWVNIEKIDENSSSDITVENLTMPIDRARLGSEVGEWFHRCDWLDTHHGDDILDARYQIRPTTAVQRILTPVTQEVKLGSGTGFQEHSITLSRTDSVPWSHTIDDAVYRILAGLNPQGLTLRDVIGLYYAVHDAQLDEPTFTSEEECEQAMIPIAVDLIRHGILLPEDFLDDSGSTY